jgi:hypothetical protein
VEYIARSLLAAAALEHALYVFAEGALAVVRKRSTGASRIVDALLINERDEGAGETEGVSPALLFEKEAVALVADVLFMNDDGGFGNGGKEVLQVLDKDGS